ncbi:putative LRR receptor-like serine/threonine-protein kinase RKF3 [Iris pallida]|uniref:non-specific serine/threonine protein kinase n=1 Tax=Iris pallida TaxID=29817 RepID=A0AAX6FLB4_IRIPA|nr:putative LRR receptor-like serine/threonine-protein kinase RKF3 [Iris pallida]
MKQISLLFFLFLLLLLPEASFPQPNSSRCPLDFSVLEKFVAAAQANPSWVPSSLSNRCDYALQYLHLAQAQFLRTNSLFLIPNTSSSTSACLSSLSSLLSPLLPSSLLSDCGLLAQSLSSGCANLTSLSDFDSLVPPSARADASRACNASLGDSLYASQCTACTASLTRLNAYLPGPDRSNLTRCNDYPFIYAAGNLSLAGPADPSTAACLFLLQIHPSSPSSSRGGGGGSSTAWVYGLVAGCFLLLLLLGAGSCYLLRRRKERLRKLAAARVTNTPSPALDSVAASTSLVKFRFEEVRAATKNFSRDRIIGRGGYGNVYRGVLADGSEVALKRFKNCSAAGDASFAHEVEVIASVRHVNLVALRGYCTATTPMEGHQRIIVCDLMRNGSLHDHLYCSEEDGRGRLSWPARQKIAVGTARGLAYLHYGAQPAIIHRDIKASNILLDDGFEPKVADFGLARFAPEGMSHVSTRVAGTLGYVAPEYALYGQLTEKSDVYSFGVVMLELLSGKKAFLSAEQNLLITDWAWSLVRTGRALDVIEDGMKEVGPREVMEKYVLLAVLASHPQLHARPTMDQVLKILETDVAVPSIPDRPLPIVANLDDIEKSVSSSGSGQLTSFAGYQPYASFGNEVEVLIRESESDFGSNRMETDDDAKR